MRHVPFRNAPQRGVRRGRRGHRALCSRPGPGGEEPGPGSCSPTAAAAPLLAASSSRGSRLRSPPLPSPGVQVSLRYVLGTLSGLLSLHGVALTWLPPCLWGRGGCQVTPACCQDAFIRGHGPGDRCHGGGGAFANQTLRRPAHLGPSPSRGIFPLETKEVWTLEYPCLGARHAEPPPPPCSEITLESKEDVSKILSHDSKIKQFCSALNIHTKSPLWGKKKPRLNSFSQKAFRELRVTGCRIIRRVCGHRVKPSVLCGVGCGGLTHEWGGGTAHPPDGVMLIVARPAFHSWLCRLVSVSGRPSSKPSSFRSLPRPASPPISSRPPHPKQHVGVFAVTFCSCRHTVMRALSPVATGALCLITLSLRFIFAVFVSLPPTTVPGSLSRWVGTWGRPAAGGILSGHRAPSLLPWALWHVLELPHGIGGRVPAAPGHRRAAASATKEGKHVSPRCSPGELGGSHAGPRLAPPRTAGDPWAGSGLQG